MAASLVLDTEQKPLEGAKGWLVKAFEIAKKESAGFDGTISIKPPNATERTHINWTAVYQGEGNWRLINKKTSTTVLHELRSVNTALQTFISEHLNAHRAMQRAAATAQQPVGAPSSVSESDTNENDVPESFELQRAPEEALLRKRGRPKSPPAPEREKKEGGIPPAPTLGDVIRHRLAYSVKEVAEILGISEKTIRRLIVLGELRVIRKMRHLIIPKTELERFLNEATPKENVQVQVGNISIPENIQKENEGVSGGVPIEHLLHLLSDIKATGVLAVDDVNELTRFIEFFRGILPPKKYVLTYQLNVNRSGQTGAVLELRPVK